MRCSGSTFLAWRCQSLLPQFCPKCLRAFLTFVSRFTSITRSLAIVADGFDAGIRLGELIAEDMVAVRLTSPFKAIIVAAPSYLATHGRPESIADLRGHNCIAFRQIKSGGLYRWDLTEHDHDIAVDSPGSAIINDPLYARELALAGTGLAYIFEPLVTSDIAAGRLMQVLPKSAIEQPGLFLYFTRRADMAPKLRAFIDTVKDVLGPVRQRRIGQSLNDEYATCWKGTSANCCGCHVNA